MGKRLLAIALGLLLGLVVVEIALQAAALFVSASAGRAGTELPSGERFRILAIGDSNTFGIGMPRTRAYPAQLERYLNASAGAERFEVVNLGVPGSNSSQVVQNLSHYIELYEPELLIVVTGVNDYWNPAETPPQQGEGLLPRLHRVLSHLRTYRLGVLLADELRAVRAPAVSPTLETLQTRTGQGGPDDAAIHELHLGDETVSFRNERRNLLLTDEQHAALLAQNLRRIVEIAGAAGIPLVLPTYAPNLGHYAVANQTIQNVQGTTVVPQIFQRFLVSKLPRPRPKNDDLFFPDLHPRGPVYRVYAQNLCEELVKHGLVPIERCVDDPDAAPGPSGPLAPESSSPPS